MTATARALALLVCVVLAAGCAARTAPGPGPAPHTVLPPHSAPIPQSPVAPAPHASSIAPSPAPRHAPGRTDKTVASASADWERFSHTSMALRREIRARAAALREGPVGNRAVELASLRLASSGRDLIDSESPDGAHEALDRAIALWDGNGYAYLFLAYVHHVQGRDERAVELAAHAKRLLPTDESVHLELEGLSLAIRVRATTPDQ